MSKVAVAVMRYHCTQILDLRADRDAGEDVDLEPAKRAALRSGLSSLLVRTLAGEA